VSEVLVVAGEASGDRLAALAARALAARGIACAGAGGPGCRAAGMEILADTAALSAMGLADVARRLPAIARGAARILDRARRRPPRAALLVNFTELNQRLGRLLRARGIRVVWCVAPQVWAWRAGRLRTLRGAFDRLALILPFEEPLWRAHDHDARYVGHPALEALPGDRAALRRSLGVAPAARALAVLPGSRAGEIRRLAGPLCQAAAALRAEGAFAEARVILAAGLDPVTRALALAEAGAAGLPAVDADPERGAVAWLDAFDASLCASGTASLEAALAGAAPVVAARLDRAAYAVARHLVIAPHIALPNVILARRAFPELIQEEATAPAIAAAARRVLSRDDGPALAAELRRALRPPPGPSFGERLAALLLDP
jgi:lipid-A-disaccharide synthase